MTYLGLQGILVHVLLFLFVPDKLLPLGRQTAKGDNCVKNQIANRKSIVYHYFNINKVFPWWCLI